MESREGMPPTAGFHAGSGATGSSGAPPPGRRRNARAWLRPLVILGALWITWLVVAFLVGPQLLESAFAGTSFSFLNDMIRGRDVHGLDYYLAIWAGQVRLVTLALIVVTAATGLAYRFRATVVPLLVRTVGAVSTPRPLTPLQIALSAGWIGVVLGVAEASKPAIQRLFSDWPTGEYYAEGLWMVPLANALTLIAIALLLVPFALAVWPRRQGLRVIPAIVGTIAVFTFIRYLGGFHPAAAIVLAAGTTMAAMRFARARPDTAHLLIRRSGAVLASALVVYGSGIVAVNRLSEYRATRSLADAPAGAWNVLLLILDTVRAADVSVLGYDRPTTPNLERLASGGVVFERAWSTAPWTLPAHASMFTGVSPTLLSTHYLVPLDDSYPTIAEVLTRNGWLSGGFVSNYFYAGRSSGLARGFIHYDGHPTTAASIAMSARLPIRIRRKWDKARSDAGRLVYKTAEDVNRAFLDWLPDTEDRPFFAFLNYLDAHDPYTPPEPWGTRWAEPGDRYGYGFNAEYSTADLQQLRDRYDGAIAYIDDQIGQLMDQLEARGRLDNTLIIVASDHGEEFGEHHPALVQHGWSLYSQALHVPMLLIMPGKVPAGERISDVVSTGGIAATILDLVLPDEKAALPGESFARFWATSDENEPDGDQVVSVAQLNPRETPPASTPIHSGGILSIVEGDLHFIRRDDGVEELYSIRTDPAELTDLASDPAFERRLAYLRRQLRTIVGDAPGN